MNYMPMNITPQWFLMMNYLNSGYCNTAQLMQQLNVTTQGYFYNTVLNNLVETQKNKEYTTEDEQILESLNWD